MFAEDPSYLQKLWDRGVDIGVGVTTSVLVALIGLAFWRAKLELDRSQASQIRKDQYRDEDERDAAKKRTLAQELYARQKEQRAIFLAKLSGVQRRELAGFWRDVVDWIETEEGVRSANLQLVVTAEETIRRFSTPPSSLDEANHRLEVRRMIERLVIPEPNR